MTRSLVLLTALALAACGTDDAASPEATPAAAATPEASGEMPPGDHGAMALSGATTYTCVDGSSFTLSPSADGAMVEAALPDRKLTLDRMDASSGLRYGDGSVVVWIADGGAFVVENEEPILKDCTAATDA